MSARSYKVPILLPADPTALLEAATKQYVDNLLWNVPRGVIAKGTFIGSNPVNVAAPAGTQVDLASLTATLVTNRRYRLTYVSRASNPKGVQFWLVESGAQLTAFSDPWFRVENTWTETNISWIFDCPAVLSAGSHTLIIRAYNNSAIACQFYHDPQASYWILEDLGPTTVGSFPLPPTQYGVTYPAEAGPRGDNAAHARFGNFDVDDDCGYCAGSGGNLDLIMVQGQGAAFWERLEPSSHRILASIAWDTGYNAAVLKADGMAIGGSMHPGYCGIWKDGAGVGDYALIVDNSYNMLLNARSSMGFRLNNGSDKMSIGVNDTWITNANVYITQNGANRFWATGGNTFIDVGGGTFFGRLSGNDKIAYNNSQFNTYVQCAVRASVGTNPWDQANIVCTSSMDMQRISFNSPGIAPQLRSNSAYGDHLEVINNPGSGYSNIRAAAFPVASSLAIKRDVRPIRVRDLPPISHDPRMDTVPDLNIMALRPVAFRPKVPALMIVGKEKKKSVSRPLDDLRGHEGSRERLGLIAEEVEKVIPSAVDHYQDGTMGAIDYAQITVALLDHVQRLTDEVATLRYRIAELEKE